MNIRQLRDITVIEIDEAKYIGIACDSCGGIGLKSHDVVNVDPKITAYQTGKVVLAELMCMGFKPLVMADGLAVEMNDTGKILIEGFKEVISRLKTANVHLTGSTEENIITVQTSMGITCMGVCEKTKLKYKKTNKNDACLLVGEPFVGNEVLNNPDKIMDIDDFENLYTCDFINEIIPVGSRGVEAELNDLCKLNDLEININRNIKTDLKKSGGPSCSAIVTADEKYIQSIISRINKPVAFLGTFK